MLKSNLKMPIFAPLLSGWTFSGMFSRTLFYCIITGVVVVVVVIAFVLYIQINNIWKLLFQTQYFPMGACE